MATSDSARTDHHQPPSGFAREVGGSKCGGGRRAPERQCLPIDHGERLPGVAAHQEIGAVDAREASRGIAREYADDLHAKEAPVRTRSLPRGHEEKHRRRLARTLDRMVVPDWDLHLAPERAPQRFDESRESEGMPRSGRGR